MGFFNKGKKTHFGMHFGSLISFHFTEFLERERERERVHFILFHRNLLMVMVMQMVMQIVLGSVPLDQWLEHWSHEPRVMGSILSFKIKQKNW